MFFVSNEKLVQMIRKSTVLKHKLNEEQMEKFILRALSLPPAGQAELQKKLEEEMDLVKKQEDTTRNLLQELQNYNTHVQNELVRIKKETFTQAEKDKHSEDEDTMINLLKKIDKD